MAPAALIRTSWRLARSTCLLAALLGIVLMLALTSSARAAAPGRTLGVYAGAGNPRTVANFESRLGRPVALVHDTLARDSWSAMTDVRWWVEQWAASRYRGRVVYTVPMLPNSGGSLAAGAAGAYNGYFRTLAARLVAGGQGGATLRLGPEFNGNWFRWTISTPGGGANYAAYWRQIVTTMRAVPGAKFKFDWCPNAGSSWVSGSQLKAETAWPGDGYVDYVGLDVYDQSWIANHRDPAARWKDYLNTGNGLRWQRDFAGQHRKPMTFPEWGLSSRSDGHGGGDAPYFVEQMHAWIKANNVAYHMYFEYADSDGDYAIFGGRTPNAAKRFKELFGTDADGSEAARLSIRRARISRRSQRLSVLATLAPNASGAARVTLSAGGRKTRFSKKVRRGRLKISRKISRAQARRGTGTVTVSYGGSARTRPQKVRLRVAPGQPGLRPLGSPRIDGSRLSASGKISRRARGAVRIQLQFEVAGRSVTREFPARIRAGRWRLSMQLPAAVSAELARRTGGVHAYAIFGGSRRVAGAMKLYELLGAR